MKASKIFCSISAKFFECFDNNGINSSNTTTREDQEDVCNALIFKTQVLWSMLDALHFSYHDPGIIPPGAFVPKE